MRSLSIFFFPHILNYKQNDFFFQKMCKFFGNNLEVNVLIQVLWAESILDVWSYCIYLKKKIIFKYLNEYSCLFDSVKNNWKPFFLDFQTMFISDMMFEPKNYVSFGAPMNRALMVMIRIFFIFFVKWILNAIFLSIQAKNQKVNIKRKPEDLGTLNQGRRVNKSSAI